MTKKHISWEEMAIHVATKHLQPIEDKKPISQRQNTLWMVSQIQTLAVFELHKKLHNQEGCNHEHEVEFAYGGNLLKMK